MTFTSKDSKLPILLLAVVAAVTVAVAFAKLAAPA
jgi:hypothetical protein